MKRDNFMKMFATGFVTPFAFTDGVQSLNENEKPMDAVRVFGTMSELKKAVISDFDPHDYVRVLGYHRPGDGGAGSFFWNPDATESANEGTIFKPAYSQFKGPGRWKKVEKDILSVKEFGAAGDGKTNDSAAIQRAVNALNEGMRLYFPSGTYLLRSNISFQKVDNIVIESSQARIYADASGDIQYIFDFINCSNIIVKGFRFSADGNKISVVRTESVHSFIFCENYITHCDNGVVSRKEGSGCYDFKLMNNTAYDPNYVNISKENQTINVLFYGYGPAKRWHINNNTLLGGGHLTLGTEAEGWIVDGNSCVNTSDSSIYLRGTNHTIVNNKIYNAGKDGIKTLVTPGDHYGQAKQSIISNNFVKNSGQIVKTGGSNINIDHENSVISNNIVQLADVKDVPSKSTVGIIAMGKSSNITNNIISGKGSGNGITLKSDGNSCDNTSVSGNTISDIGVGIYLSQIAQNSFHNIRTDNNSIEDCKTGIKIESNNHSLLTGYSGSNNSISKARISAFYCAARGMKNSVFENNMITNLSADYAIRANHLNSDFIFRNNISDGSAKKRMFEQTSAQMINNISDNKTETGQHISKNKSFTVLNDDFNSFDPQSENGIVTISGSSSAKDSIIISFNFQGTANEVIALTDNTNIQMASGALTGKSGKTGEITVGHEGGKLFIENRRGRTQKISYNVLNSF